MSDLLTADGPRIQAWLHSRSGLPLMQEFIGIAREVDGQIVAAFGYDNFQQWSCCLHTATDVPWGYNRTLLRTAFTVPYVQWDYRCLLAIIQVGNQKSMNIADRLGFTEIAVVPEAHPAGGLRFLKMKKEDCRWLRLPEQRDVRRRRISTLSSIPEAELG